jgi:hypothetical protein
MSNIVPADAAALPGLRMAAAARILNICLAPHRHADSNVTDTEILHNMLSALPLPQRRLLQGRLFRLIDAEGQKSMTQRDLVAWNDAVAELRGLQVVNKVAPTTTATLSVITADVKNQVANSGCYHYQLMQSKAVELAAHPDDTTLQLQVQLLSLVSTDASPQAAAEKLAKRFIIRPKFDEAQSVVAEDEIDPNFIIPLGCNLKDQVAQQVLDECCDPNYAAEDAEADEEKQAADGSSSSSDSSSDSDISAEKKKAEKEEQEVPLSPELGRASSEEELEEEPAGEAPGSSSRRRARTIVVHKQRRSVRAKKQ